MRLARMFTRMTAGLLAAGASLLPAAAQESAGGSDTFVRWSVEQAALPEYPARALREGAEGYVDLAFMVDKEGRAQQATIARALGRKEFEGAALTALQNIRFKPATLDGVPVEAAGSYRYYFTLDGTSTGTRRFMERYNAFRASLESGEAEQIDAALAALEAVGSSNHYEHAYLYFARFNRAQSLGSEREQMEYLHGALSFADTAEDHIFIPEAAQPGMWRALLTLQAKNQFFAEALDTWSIMQATQDEEGLAMFPRVIEAIDQVKRDGTEFAIPFTLPESGFLWHSLFKRGFYISAGEGNVVEMALYCDTSYTVLPLDRDVDYQLPESWGTCEARISGDAGASFYLVQH